MMVPKITNGSAVFKSNLIVIVIVTSNAGIDTRNSIIINNQSTQTIKERKVFKLNNLIVRQINCVELVLPNMKKEWKIKIRLIVQPKPSCIYIHKLEVIKKKKSKFSSNLIKRENSWPQWHPSFLSQESCYLKTQIRCFG